ncbi:autotransporter family protein [Marinicauda pacifica]|uniref:autotransporter family protein n=1 Tax=Marinicauda pacifica TaxID=1133559 RepID=UPI0035C80E17
MRARLLAAASLTVLAASAAWADEEVTEERTSPISTANADGQGNADNIVISENGRVTLTGQTGPAVLLNSDNSVTLESGSVVRVDNVSGATAIEVQGGNEGELDIGGAISLSDDYQAEDGDDDDMLDTDGDGEPDGDLAEADGPFAEETDKVGVHVTGTSAFIGDIVSQAGSSISVEGQNSYGLLVESGGIDGNLNLGGSVSIVGENSTAVLVRGGVTGDVTLGGAVNSRAPAGEGIAIEGDIGQGFQLTGTVTTSGYRPNSRPSEILMPAYDVGDDDLNSGAAIRIAGNVQNGIYIYGGSDEAAAGQIIVRSEAPALHVQPGAGSGDVTIGRVVLPEGVDPARESLEDRTLDYSLVQEGDITALGMFDGKNAQGVLLSASEDGQRSLTIEGGVHNTGRVDVNAFDATATAVRLGQGVSTPLLLNEGTITARASRGYDGDGFADNRIGTGRAFGLVVDSGADIQELRNAGTIGAIVAGDGDGGAAILVQSDSLQSIENSGVIAMATENLVDGASVEALALDARTQTAGLTLRQYDADTSDTATPSITGNVRLGSGADTVRLEAGALNGDLFFGDGDDNFVLRNANFGGALSDTDGRLTIDAENATLTLNSGSALNLTSARFGTGAALDVLISTGADPDTAFLAASDTISFESGSELSVSLQNLISADQTFQILTAGDLQIDTADGNLTATDAPYLYNASVVRPAADPNSLVLSLERKTAGELGMDANQARAYDPAFQAVLAVEELGAAFASLRNSTDFFAAYDQLLPEYAASAIQFALASNDAAQGALGTRLQNARLSPDELAGVWVQEFGYYADRSGSALGPGYRGEGIGLALGIDRPMGPFYAVGFNVVGAASEIESVGGFDDPMVALTGQLGTYAALDLGGWDVSGSAALGYDRFETERNIIVGSFSATSTAEWSGWHVTASSSVGRDFLIAENWILRPEANLTYMSLFESGYTESTTSSGNNPLGLIVDDRESSTLTAAATLSLARRFGTDTSWWAPSVRVGYRGDLLNGDAETTARFGESGSPFTLQGAELAGSGGLVGLGLSAGSNYSTFTFAYDADVREDFIRHVARLIIRLTF